MPSNTQPRFTSNEEYMAAVEFSVTLGITQNAVDQNYLIHSLMESVNHLHEQLELSNNKMASKEAEMSSLRQELSSAKRYLQRNTKKLHLLNERNSTISNTTKATHSLVQKLSKNNVSNSNIINDIIGYMASKQYL